MNDKLSLAEGPYYGEFGGRFVPESLIHALDELESAYKAAKRDPAFQEELAHLHTTYSGRPSIITARRRAGVQRGIFVCQGRSCRGKRSEAVLQEIEELAKSWSAGDCVVESTGCLGKVALRLSCWHPPSF